MTFDKPLGIVVGVLGVLGSVVAVVSAYDHLNSRLDRVDEKIAAIQKTLGSTTCNSILSRQMEAIDKNKPSVREALDTLSKQYGCGPQSDVVVVPDVGIENVAATASNTAAASISYDSRRLNEQLNRVDAQLNSKN